MNSDNEQVINSKDEDQTWVMDSLVGFLKSPLWSTSLNDFIDRHSIIFDPEEIEDNDGNVIHNTEYMDIFLQYRRLVDQLIGSHMIDLGINEKQFAKACQIAEGVLAAKLKRILFEELWAAENYDVFVRLMAKRNVELQLEALEILVRKYGLVYDVFVPVGTSPKNFLSEDHVLREAIIRSLNDMALDDSDDNNDNVSLMADKIIKQNVKVDVETKNDDISSQIEKQSSDSTNDASEIAADKDTVQRDAAKLIQVKHEIKQKMDEALQSAFIDDKTVEPKEADLIQAKSKNIAKKSKDTNISAEDIHKRADYLRTQRDKILSQRQKERSEKIFKYLIKEKQKQSEMATKKSSDEAANEMTNEQNTTATIDDELAFRKSLAARLKAEVVNVANSKTAMLQQLK